MLWYRRYKWCYRHARNFCLFICLQDGKHARLVAPFVAYRRVYSRAIERRVKRKCLFGHTFFSLFIWCSFVQNNTLEQTYESVIINYVSKLSYAEYLMLLSCKEIQYFILLLNFKGYYIFLIGVSKYQYSSKYYRKSSYLLPSKL